MMVEEVFVSPKVLLATQATKTMVEATNAYLEARLALQDIKMTEEQTKIVLLWQPHAIQDTKTMVEETSASLRVLPVTQATKMMGEAMFVFFKVRLVILVTKTMVVSLKNVSF